jgi:L-ascorbate metabolism protein UlaG (beta-lactamase superfamily)
VKIGEIKADYVLLSHAHQDHVADAFDILSRTGAVLMSNYEICMYFAKKGIKTFRPMNTGGAVTTKNFIVKSVNAIHSSSFDDGANGGCACGFVISSDEGNFYYAGDTALTEDMKLIGEPASSAGREHKLNFAFLPIGDNFTMGYMDAIRAADFVKCNHVIAMHYDTFDLIKVDTVKVEQAFEKAGKRITFMKIGETKEIF